MMISRHLLVCLMNGDEYGLNNDERMLLNQLAEDVGTATLDISWDDVKFCRCDYSGLFDDCLEVNLIKNEV